MIPGRAIKIDHQILQEFVARNPPARNFLLQAYLAALSEITQRAICNGKHQLARRLSLWLLRLFEQTPHDALPLTHDLIAQKLGARRAGITSAAGNLQTAGAIQYNRGSIQLLDRKRLEQEACECYRLAKC
jgi:CRP-like cAMP-binding protein